MTLEQDNFMLLTNLKICMVYLYFLKYYNIVSNIPKAWKNKLKNENHNILTKKINKALNAVTKQKGSVNKTLYNLQFKSATVNNIKAEEKWAKEFPQQELK